MSNIYKPKYNIKEPDYLHIWSTEYEVEYSGIYKTDQHILHNPPDRTKLIEKIIKLIKGTGIAKISITLFPENL